MFENVRKLVKAHNQHIASPMIDNNKSSYQAKKYVISSQMWHKSNTLLTYNQ